jgi:hypothetical protein
MPLPDEPLRAALRASGDFLSRRRPPPEIRDQLDLKVEIKNRDLLLLEVRPQWNDKSKTQEHPVAKMKWVGTQNVWRLFWMRQDLKWHLYEPKPEARSIKALFEEVERDPHGCFFG